MNIWGWAAVGLLAWVAISCGAGWFFSRMKRREKRIFGEADAD